MIENSTIDKNLTNKKEFFCCNCFSHRAEVVEGEGLGDIVDDGLDRDPLQKYKM